MTKKICRWMSIGMVICILVSMFAGCRKTPSNGSYYSYYESDDAVYEDNGNNNAGNQNGNAGANNNNTNPSSRVNQNQNNGQGGTGKNGNNKNVYSYSGINYLVDPEKYRGTSITYVTWKDPNQNEDGEVVKKFEKKYGIKVNIQLVDEGKYASTIAANIAAGTQGDVFFQNNNFPASLSVMQPLDAAKINYKDPIWKQETLQASMLDGHPYLVDTVSNVWGEVDICVYNKSLFEDNGITSPAEYYAAGNWTFETFEKACRDIAKLGKNYHGATLMGESVLGAAGVSVFTYKDNQMKMTVNDRVYNILQWMSQLYTEGVIEFGGNGFESGKTGMALTNCFALKKTGYYPNIKASSLAATYLPRYDKNSPQVTTGIYRGWGLIKGSKNPEAAGIFLREYLDVNNYDLNKTFINSDVADFFFKVTGASTKNMVYYHTFGVLKANGSIDEHDMYEKALDRSWRRAPAEMKPYIDSQINVLNNMCAQANNIIKTERAWIAKNY